MTREEIEKAYAEKYECPRPSGVYQREYLIGISIAINFAMEMVRLAKDEDVAIYKKSFNVDYDVTEEIRKSKP